MSLTQKCPVFAAASGTTCGDSSVSSKATSVGGLSLLPKSMRKCPYCYRFGSSEHIQRCGQQEVNCIECGIVIQASLMSAHVMYTCEKRDKLKECIGCGSLFLPADMRDHLMSSCQGSHFPCDICCQTFITPAEYAAHLYNMPNPCCKVIVKKKSEESSSFLKKNLKHDKKSDKKCCPSNHSKTAVLLSIKDGNPLYADVHQIKCGFHDEAESQSSSANFTEVVEGEGLIKRTSEDRDMSSCRRRSKFVQNTAIFSTDNQKFPAQTVHVPAAHTLSACKRGVSTNIYEENNLADVCPTTKVFQNFFLTRSLKVLKELQEKHEIISKELKKQSRNVIPSAPRLATSELHAKRTEKFGGSNKEKGGEVIRDDVDTVGATLLRCSTSTNFACRVGQRKLEKEKASRGFIAPPRHDVGRTHFTAALSRNMSCPARVSSSMTYRKQEKQGNDVGVIRNGALKG